MRKDRKDKLKKKLEVRKDKLRELSPKELEQATGGYIQPTKTGNCYGPQ